MKTSLRCSRCPGDAKAKGPSNCMAAQASIRECAQPCADRLRARPASCPMALCQAE